MKYAVQTKVRPYAEIVEVESQRGLQTAAIVYGRTAEEANARAELIARYLQLEATPKYIKRRLQLLVLYRWAHKHCQLLKWLLACVVDPEVLLAQLRAEATAFGSTARPERRPVLSTARVLGSDEAEDFNDLI